MIADRLIHKVKEGEKMVPRFVVSTVDLGDIAKGQYETIVFLANTNREVYGERHFSGKKALERHYQIMYDIVAGNLIMKQPEFKLYPIELVN